jgi:hypothetical protein
MPLLEKMGMFYGGSDGTPFTSRISLQADLYMTHED